MMPCGPFRADAGWHRDAHGAAKGSDHQVSVVRTMEKTTTIGAVHLGKAHTPWLVPPDLRLELGGVCRDDTHPRCMPRRSVAAWACESRLAFTPMAGITCHPSFPAESPLLVEKMLNVVHFRQIGADTISSGSCNVSSGDSRRLPAHPARPDP